MEKLLLSKPVVESCTSSLQKECQQLKDRGVIPSMAVILVGQNPASLVYVRNKKNLCEKIGAHFSLMQLSEDTDEKTLLQLIKQVNEDKKIHGCFVQLPLPKHLKHVDVTSLIAPSKDVDGFHYESIRDIYFDHISDKTFVPCTPKGIMTLFDFYNIDLEGKHVAIVGRSHIVGKPLQLLLTNKNATVTLCHSKTKNLEAITQSADIIVAAIGKAKFLTLKHFRNDETQIVVDVGMNNDEQNKLCGDVDFENVVHAVKLISPVPGGVGPLTVLSLMQNLLIAAKRNMEI